MSFTTLGLAEPIVARLSRLGFTEPTPIQREAIPVVLSGSDVIGLAQTGTGKTAAFSLPLIQRLGASQPGSPRALIIAPTRELAEQVHSAYRTFAQGTGLRSAVIYGGVAMGPQEGALRRGLDVLVGCPGRLLDHVRQGTLRLDRVQFLVLDEADRMLDMGFMPDIRRIISLIPGQHQTLLFSATMEPEMAELAASITTNPTTVQVGIIRPPATVSHALYPVLEARKADMLIELIHSAGTGSVLVFTRTKHRADRVAQHLEGFGHRVARLHSNRSQRQRQIALDGFRNGTYSVLVATDIAARGIDVSRVSHVINFDIPDTPDAYIHRIGRTGRAERTGDAFTLATHEDRAMVRAIEKTLGSPLERRSVSGFEPIEINTAIPGGATRHPQGNRQPHGGSRPPFARSGSGPRRDDRPTYPRNERGDRRDDRRDDRPAFARDERGERGERSDRPAYPRNEQRRDDRPAFARDERGERGQRSDRPSAPRNEQRRDDRPAFARDERGERSDRPSAPRHANGPRRDDRPAFVRGERRDRPSRPQRDDRPITRDA